MRPASNPVVGDPAFHLRALEQFDASAWFEYAARPEVKLHTSSHVTAIDDLHAMIERSHSSDPNSPVLLPSVRPLTSGSWVPSAFTPSRP
jgi:hypothetical protein